LATGQIASNSTAPEFQPEEPELNLLRRSRTGQQRAEDWRQWRLDAALSAAVHAVVIVTLFLIPEGPPPPPEKTLRVLAHVTPLYVPRDLTQKAPNLGKVQKQITVASIAPRPAVKTPSPAPAARPTPPPSLQPAATPAPVPHPVVEPPKVAVDAPPAPAPPVQAQTPQPPPVQETPKLALQDVAPPAPRNAPPGRSSGLLAPPNASVQEAIRNLARGGAPQGGLVVGDLGADEGGAGAGLNLPPSAGRPRSNLELKSDPMGVDFRPYLLQVLAAVRRNWFAVYPEAARLGQKGQVVLQFAIAKQGAVAKVVFSTESGAKALDQAAVAAISASNPLPPLPAEFRGDRIVLQMTFQYNQPR